MGIFDHQVLVPILAVLITYLLTSRHYKNQKGHEFNEHRLNEFYSPVLGRINKTRSDGELRVSISRATDKAWQEKCDRFQNAEFDHDKHFEPHNKSIEYDNQKFRNETMQIYEGNSRYSETRGTSHFVQHKAGFRSSLNLSSYGTDGSTRQFREKLSKRSRFPKRSFFHSMTM